MGFQWIMIPAQRSPRLTVGFFSLMAETLLLIFGFFAGR